MATAPFDGSAFSFDIPSALQLLDSFDIELSKLNTARHQLTPMLKFFGIEAVNNRDIAQIENDVAKLREVWVLKVIVGGPHRLRYCILTITLTAILLTPGSKLKPNHWTISPFSALVSFQGQWDAAWAAIGTQPFSSINVSELDSVSDSFMARLVDIKEGRTWPIWRKTQHDLEQFRNSLPLIANLLDQVGPRD